MLNRFTSSHVVLALGIVAAISLGLFLIAQNGDETPSPPDVPEALRVEAHQGMTLTWVITRNAYASCRQPAYVLRRIKQRYGDEVTLVVWHEAHGRSDVQHILTRERLSAKLVPLDAQAYEQWLGHPPAPALHLIDDNRLVKTWMYTRRSVQAKEVMALL